MTNSRRTSRGSGIIDARDRYRAAARRLRNIGTDEQQWHTCSLWFRQTDIFTYFRFPRFIHPFFISNVMLMETLRVGSGVLQQPTRKLYFRSTLKVQFGIKNNMAEIRVRIINFATFNWNLAVAYRGEGFGGVGGGSNPHPHPKFRKPSKIVPTQPNFENC